MEQLNWTFLAATSVIAIAVAILTYSKFTGKNDTNNTVTEEVISDQWTNMAPTSPTTFPTIWFTLYLLLAISLLPIHLVLVAMNYMYQSIMHLINALFYLPTKALLKPIHASPSSHVIITGSASGIGKDIAFVFASKGFSLILIDLSPSLKQYATELQHKFKTITVKHLIIDLSQTLASNTIYDTIIKQWKLKNIDILVNCAGFGMAGEFLNQDITKLRTMVNVNSMCCIELAHVFGRYFVKRGKGRICQIASAAAFLPGPHSAVYHATKVFTRNWALALNHELIGTGVGVTLVCPGPVKTNFGTRLQPQKSLVWYLSWLIAESLDVANAAVHATLNGTQEVVYSPFWGAVMYALSFYGETFNIIITKLMWQAPNATFRSSYSAYKYANDA